MIYAMKGTLSKGSIVVFHFPRRAVCFRHFPLYLLHELEKVRITVASIALSFIAKPVDDRQLPVLAH